MALGESILPGPLEDLQKRAYPLWVVLILGENVCKTGEGCRLVHGAHLHHDEEQQENQG